VHPSAFGAPDAFSLMSYTGKMCSQTCTHIHMHTFIDTCFSKLFTLRKDDITPEKKSQFLKKRRKKITFEYEKMQRLA
jgi:diadenosine tetraphosphate (Ap4A) HIT family hydrolase